MHVLLATDHAGYAHKEVLKTWLTEQGHTVTDYGAFALDPADDYPDFIIPAVTQLQTQPEARAVILGGSGQGEAMVANKLPGARAVVYYGGDIEILKLSREHNDANVLSLGARFISSEEAIRALEIWLSTPFSADERHIRRLKKLPHVS